MASTVLPLEYDVVPTLPLVRAHLVINCVLVFVAWSVVALRVMARKWSGAGLGWDDYLIVAALVRLFSLCHLLTKSRARAELILQEPSSLKASACSSCRACIASWASDIP